METRIQLKAKLIVFVCALLMSACVEVYHGPGPNGHPGRAFFSINYTHVHPYSYWDNNPNVPFNPIIGHNHLTAPGIYEFEYFINPYEYWFGTYEVWVNPGGPGRPYGEPGLNGPDNFFILWCDPHGYFEDRYVGKTAKGQDSVSIVKEIGADKIRVHMKKTTVDQRQPHQPKVTW